MKINHTKSSPCVLAFKYVTLNHSIPLQSPQKFVYISKHSLHFSLFLTAPNALTVPTHFRVQIKRFSWNISKFLADLVTAQSPMSMNFGHVHSDGNCNWLGQFHPTVLLHAAHLVTLFGLLRSCPTAFFSRCFAFLAFPRSCSLYCNFGFLLTLSHTALSGTPCKESGLPIHCLACRLQSTRL